jgi:hypothetical protein
MTLIKPEDSLEIARLWQEWEKAMLKLAKAPHSGSLLDEVNAWEVKLDEVLGKYGYTLESYLAEVARHGQ